MDNTFERILNRDENPEETPNLALLIHDLNYLENCFEGIYDNVLDEYMEEHGFGELLDKEVFIDYMKENCPLYSNLQKDIEELSVG